MAVESKGAEVEQERPAGKTWPVYSGWPFSVGKAAVGAAVHEMVGGIWTEL